MAADVQHVALAKAIGICLGQLPANGLDYIFSGYLEITLSIVIKGSYAPSWSGNSLGDTQGEEKKYTAERLDNVLQIG